MVQPPPLPIPVAGNQPVIVDQTQPPAEGEPVTSAITGEETPYRVDPGMSDRLQGLLEQLNGMVGGGELGGAMRERALENLENPSAYDDPLFQRGLEQAQRQIDDYYGGLQNRLEQDLGSRGIAYNSSIANTDFNRLASEQGRAFQDVMTNLLQDRARTLAQDRAQAFREASGVRGQDWGEGTDLAGNLFGIESSLRGEERGERAYVDSLRRQGRSDAIEEAMLGESLRRQREADLQGALAALAQQGSPDQAARLLAALGGQYGDIANTTQAGLADLASQFTQRY